MTDAKLYEEEGQLIELKARAEDLQKIRRKLINMGAKHVGTYHQIDTYFEVPTGRLKLRETSGKKEAELIYYEREDKPEPKRSNVYIIKIPNSMNLKNILKKILKATIKVDKIREIYQYKGTQIHLDEVKGLGTFIEFERRIHDLNKDQEAVNNLKKELNITDDHLESLSYSDLLKNRGEKARQLKENHR